MSNLDKMFDEFKAEEKKTSDFFRFKEGSNKMRILTDFQLVKSVWKGQTPLGIDYVGRETSDGETIRTQGWAWAYLLETSELKIVQFGKVILSQLVELKNSAEYHFDNFPMPYDIDIKAKDAGKQTVTYTVIPARANREVSEAEMSALNKKKPIKDIIELMLEKQQIKGGKDTIEYPKEENHLDEQPF